MSQKYPPPSYRAFIRNVDSKRIYFIQINICSNKNFFPDIFISNQPEKLCPLKSRNKNAVFNQWPKKVNKNPFKFIL